MATVVENTGRRDEVPGKTCAIAAKAIRFKIGITSTPNLRAIAYGSDYKELIVIYKSQSEQIIRDLEKDMVGAFRHSSKCDNEAPGGGGDLGAAPHSLYVVWR